MIGSAEYVFKNVLEKEKNSCEPRVGSIVELLSEAEHEKKQKWRLPNLVICDLENKEAIGLMRCKITKNIENLDIEIKSLRIVKPINDVMTIVGEISEDILSQKIAEYNKKRFGKGTTGKEVERKGKLANKIHY